MYYQQPARRRENIAGNAVERAIRQFAEQGGIIGQEAANILSHYQYNNEEFAKAEDFTAQYAHYLAATTGQTVHESHFYKAAEDAVAFFAASYVRKYRQIYDKLSREDRIWADNIYNYGNQLAQDIDAWVNQPAPHNQYPQTYGNGAYPNYPNYPSYGGGAYPSSPGYAPRGSVGSPLATASSGGRYMNGQPIVPENQSHNLYRPVVISPIVESEPDYEEPIDNSGPVILDNPDQPYVLGHTTDTIIRPDVIQIGDEYFNLQVIEEIPVNYEDHDLKPTFVQLGTNPKRSLLDDNAAWSALEVGKTVKAAEVEGEIEGKSDEVRDDILAGYNNEIALTTPAFWAFGEEHALLKASNILADAGMKTDGSRSFEYYWYDIEVISVPGEGKKIREVMAMFTEATVVEDLSILAKLLREAAVPGKIIRAIDRKATSFINDVVHRSLSLPQWSIGSFMEDYDDLAAQLKERFGKRFDTHVARQFKHMARVIACMKTPEKNPDAYTLGLERIDLGLKNPDSNDIVVLASLRSTTVIPFEGVDFDLKMDAKTVTIPRETLPRLYGMMLGIVQRSMRTDDPYYRCRQLITSDGYVLEIDRGFLASESNVLLLTKK